MLLFMLLFMVLFMVLFLLLGVLGGESLVGFKVLVLLGIVGALLLLGIGALLVLGVGGGVESGVLGVCVLYLEHAVLLAEGEVGDPGACEGGVGDAGGVLAVLLGVDKLVHHVDHAEHLFYLAVLVLVDVQEPEAEVDGEARLADDLEALLVESEEFGDIPKLPLLAQFVPDDAEGGADDGAEAVLDLVGSEAAGVLGELLLELVLDVAEVLALAVGPDQHLLEVVVPDALELGLDGELAEGLQLDSDLLVPANGLEPLLDLGLGRQLQRLVQLGHLLHPRQADPGQPVGQPHEVQEGLAEVHLEQHRQVLQHVLDLPVLYPGQRHQYHPQLALDELLQPPASLH